MAHFSCLAVLFLLCITSSFAIKVVDVDTICKSVANPSFCSRLLNSNPGAKRDLVSLAQYTIDVTRINVTNTVHLIKTLIDKSGGNVEAKQHYESCLQHFGNIGDGALNMVEYTQQYLKSGDYVTASDHAYTIAVDVDVCISGESPSDPPYPDTSLLPKYAKIVYQDAEIIYRILNLLQGH